jgi:uncharacterized SAM-binding protein YcdF (DUF218 family)
VRRAGLVVLLLLLLALSAPLWLPAIGNALIRDDGPAKADAAVVLAGDQWGNRVVKGAELARDGYTPVVLVSGPEYYAMHESEAAIDFAVKRGFAASTLVGVPNSSLSTRDEAVAMVDALTRRCAHSFLLVTSDYHTARAARLYRGTLRQRAPEIQMRVVAAPDKYFHRDSWWKSRQGLKVVFLEWSKTIATAFGV